MCLSGNKWEKYAVYKMCKLPGDLIRYHQEWLETVLPSVYLFMAYVVLTPRADYLDLPGPRKHSAQAVK